ncbi:MAG: hypothetical protein ACRBN8_44310 [Nannocystales bacterium]
MNSATPNLRVLHLLDRAQLSMVRTSDGGVRVWSCAALGLRLTGPAAEARRLRGHFLRELFSIVSEGDHPSGFLTEEEEDCVHALRALDGFALELIGRSRFPEAAMLALSICRSRGELGRTVFPPSRTSSPLLDDFLLALRG